MSETSLPEQEAVRAAQRGWRLSAGVGGRELAQVREVELRVRAAGSSGSRPAVPVDSHGARAADQRPAAGGLGGGEGPRGAGGLPGVRVAGRADRGGQRGDLRGQAGGRRGFAFRRGGRKRGLCDALAREKAAEVGRLAAEAARALGCGDAGMGAAEAVLRAGLLKLGGDVLGRLLAADPGYRGPRVPCGNGHEAVFASYRGKVIDTVLGAVTVIRAWYHCAACGHGLAPRDGELGAAGASMSPGLAAMTDRAAAAVPFARAAGLLEDLAGVRLTAKRVERAAEAGGAALAAAVRDRAALIASRKLAPLPPSPPPDKLYAVIDGTGVPMASRETAGGEGKGEDGRARTREVKLAVFFTQGKLDSGGYRSGTGTPPASSPPSSPPPFSPAW